MMGAFAGAAISIFYILSGVYIARESYLGKRKPGEPYQNPCDIMCGTTLIIIGIILLWAVLFGGVV